MRSDTALKWFSGLRTALAALSVCLLGAGAHAQGVASLQLVPSVIAGGSGASATGIVTLAAPAPAGGSVIQLASSLPELATSIPQITVPAGQTTASFTVATNARYRRYSSLAFNAAISALNPLAGAAASATLNVTVQALPTDPVISPRPDRSGLVCAGEAGVLFKCPLGPDQCSVRQECTLGCQTRPSSGTSWDDICATTGPVPIALDPKRLVGGNPGAGTLQLPSAATAGSTGLVSTDSLVAAEPSRLNMPLVTGSTSHAFGLRTAAVNRIEFAPLDGRLTLLQALSDGGTFYASRSARSWLAVVPGTPPPVKLLSLRVESASLVGGQITFGTACVDQLAPAPAVGSITLALASSHPAVAPVRPAEVTLPQGSDCTSFTVETLAVATNTAVTLRAQLGAQVLTAPLLVTATPAATQATAFFLDPLSVTGGQSSQATLVLNGQAPAGGFLVTLTSDNPAVLVPSSVSVPAGADRVSFGIGTSAVGADLLVTLEARPSSSVLLAQLSVLAPAGAPTLSGVAVNPSSVAGGTTSTGTVTLSGAATSAGAVVSLASNTSAATLPASVTVPAGATTAQFAVSTLAVSTDTVATLSASLGAIGAVAVTQLTTLTITPAGQAGLAAPSLASPANGARFNAGSAVAFDWSDVAGATSYTIQIDSSSSIAAPLTATQTLSASQVTITGLPKQKLWWRVRANAASGAPGAWSVVRSFEMK